MKTRTSPTLRVQNKKTQKNYQKFIDLIIALRQLCNLSQEKVSAILGIDRATLTKYGNLNVNMCLCRYIDICFIRQPFFHRRVRKDSTTTRRSSAKHGTAKWCGSYTPHGEVSIRHTYFSG